MAMWNAPTRQMLAGGALHMQHGPIDLVLKAWGEAAAIDRALEAAWQRFGSILPALCDELPELRQPVTARNRIVPMRSPVGRRMVAACLPLSAEFITPMAAVAGAVADEMAAVLAAHGIAKAFVNNGGDIALVLEPGQSLTLGVMGDFGRGPLPAMTGSLVVRGEDAVRGVATSGARGRSFSLGIADSVTVLAANAAAADAAATLIGNAVDLDHPGIGRKPAAALEPDSDLGEALVTTAVPALLPGEIEDALRAGLARATELAQQGLIADAALSLQGRTLVLGHCVKRLEEA
ncbi:MAG: UPF0280 family protein [Beijerinckiaceae bacterium]|nr:UPF0280 family protein [Beijerinckiaceae bacterium]